MVADGVPLYVYIDTDLKNLQFPATIGVYNIINVYTIFPINLILPTSQSDKLLNGRVTKSATWDYTG